MQELFDAIKSGDGARVGALLDADPSAVDAKDERGLPPVAVAAYHRQDHIVRLLEERGAQLDIFAAAILGRTGRVNELATGNRSLARAYSQDGWTALHLAAFFGRQDAAAALLAKGAEARARSTNPLRNTPLHAAAAGRHTELARLLIDHVPEVLL